MIKGVMQFCFEVRHLRIHYSFIIDLFLHKPWEHFIALTWKQKVGGMHTSRHLRNLFTTLNPDSIFLFVFFVCVNGLNGSILFIGAFITELKHQTWTGKKKQQPSIHHLSYWIERIFGFTPKISWGYFYDLFVSLKTRGYTISIYLCAILLCNRPQDTMKWLFIYISI